jgi:hypothetical protein
MQHTSTRSNIDQQTVVVTLTRFRLIRIRTCLEDRIQFLKLMHTRAEGKRKEAIERDIAATNRDLKSMNGLLVQ